MKNYTKIAIAIIIHILAITPTSHAMGLLPIPIFNSNTALCNSTAFNSTTFFKELNTSMIEAQSALNATLKDSLQSIETSATHVLQTAQTSATQLIQTGCLEGAGCFAACRFIWNLTRPKKQTPELELPHEVFPRVPPTRSWLSERARFIYNLTGLFASIALILTAPKIVQQLPQ